MADKKAELLQKLLCRTETESDKEQLKRALTALLERKKERASPEKLRHYYTLLNKRYIFKEGQLVRWKTGMRNRQSPGDGEPAIVICLLDKPALDENKDAGSPYFMEPLDIVLGVIDDDGGFLTYHYNSQKFEPFSE